MTFGKRVLGEETHAAQSAQKKLKRERGVGLGKRVTGAGTPATGEAEEPAIKLVKDRDVEETKPEAPEATGAGAEGSEETGADGGEGSDEGGEVVTMSIADMEEALKENPAAFDSIYEAELNRPEGEPRKGALRLLLATEKLRDGGPRPEILKEINQHLKRD